MTFSPGCVQHFRRFLHPDTWEKLDYAVPACPFQSEVGRSDLEVFTLLTVGNRISDKGIPEVLRAYEVLRQRHGSKVRMLLVSNRVPRNWHLPEGVVLYDTPRMSPGLKAAVYRSADVLVELSYIDSLTNMLAKSLRKPAGGGQVPAVCGCQKPRNALRNYVGPSSVAEPTGLIRRFGTLARGEDQPRRGGGRTIGQRPIIRPDARPGACTAWERSGGEAGGGGGPAPRGDWEEKGNARI